MFLGAVPVRRSAPAPGATGPDSWATTTAWARLYRPSLVMARFAWVFTVASVTVRGG